jgi:hypothetical protein
LTVFGRLRVGKGVVAAGVLDQPGEESALGPAQLGRGFGKEVLGCGFQAKGEVAVVGLVEIETQDFGFAVTPLQLESQGRLPQFAVVALDVALLRLHQHRAGQLLGEGAGPADNRTVRTPVLPERPANRHWVHTRMPEEAAVFRGKGGLDTAIGDTRDAIAAGGRGVRDQIELLARIRVQHFVEQPPVAVQNAGGGTHQSGLQSVHSGQIGQNGQAQGQPAAQKEEQNEGKPKAGRFQKICQLCASLKAGCRCCVHHPYRRRGAGGSSGDYRE